MGNEARIIAELLDVVPEIRSEYELETEFGKDASFSDQDIAELQQLAEMHNLPIDDSHSPSITIVFEDILIPFIVSLLSRRSTEADSPSSHNRLQEIMAWIELLANSDDVWIKNAVGVSICQPLLTNYEDLFMYVIPYMGPHTKMLCRKQASLYKLNPDTLTLLEPY